MSGFIEWGSLAQVVIVGVVVGAGLPAVFALGVRSLAKQGVRDENGMVPRRRKWIAFGAFGVVIVVTLGAVAYIAGGGH